MSREQSVSLQVTGRKWSLDVVQWRHWPVWMLWAFAVLALMSVLGFSTFGLHPEWMSIFPASEQANVKRFYQASFRLFGEGQTLLLAFGLCAYATWNVRFRWLTAFAVAFAIGLGSELAGTNFGFPFGSYVYHPTWLGVRLFGHVPAVIPVSWFMMGLPSFALAYYAFPNSGQKVQRIFWGAVLLTMWDLSLDPSMSHLVSYWTWKDGGIFYGIPLQNYFGWFVTSLAIMWAYSLLRVDSWVKQLSCRWILNFYLINLLIPFCMILAGGLWVGVLVNLLVFGFCWIALKDRIVSNMDKADIKFPLTLWSRR
mgnify:CR=1 FL=1